MLADPTINDFRDQIGQILGKCENSAAKTVSNIVAKAAGRGALNSSRVPICVWEVMRNEFESRIDAVLR